MTPDSDPLVAPGSTPEAREDAWTPAERLNHALVQFLGSWSGCSWNRQQERSS